MAVDFVQQQRGGSALIVAPLTVANGGEWEKTCREWFPRKRVQLIHNDRKADLMRPADVYLINPDGVKLVAEELRRKVASGEITITVFDELTEFANHKSQRWVAAQQVSANALFRWGLTGTPGKPEKIYAQVRLINPTRVPRSKHRWREMTEVKVSQFKWIPKHGHEEIVQDAMSPCIRFDKEQLMKIPVPQVVTEEVPLTPAQQKMTDELSTMLRVMVDNNEVEATTASAVAQKLLQVSNGAVRSADGVVYVDASPKLDKLMEIIRRTPRK